MLQNLTIKARNLKTKIAIGSTLAMASVGSAMADTTAITTALTTKIGEAETFAYGLLAVSLVASIGIGLVKKFAKQGAR